MQMINNLRKCSTQIGQSQYTTLKIYQIINSKFHVSAAVSLFINCTWYFLSSRHPSPPTDFLHTIQCPYRRIVDKF